MTTKPENTNERNEDMKTIITIKSLDENPLRNMAKRISDAQLKRHGFYTCTIEGKQVKIVLEAK